MSGCTRIGGPDSSANRPEGSSGKHPNLLITKENLANSRRSPETPVARCNAPHENCPEQLLPALPRLGVISFIMIAQPVPYDLAGPRGAGNGKADICVRRRRGRQPAHGRGGGPGTAVGIAGRLAALSHPILRSCLSLETNCAANSSASTGQKHSGRGRRTSGHPSAGRQLRRVPTHSGRGKFPTVGSFNHLHEQRRVGTIRASCSRSSVPPSHLPRFRFAIVPTR